MAPHNVVYSMKLAVIDNGVDVPNLAAKTEVREGIFPRPSLGYVNIVVARFDARS